MSFPINLRLLVAVATTWLGVPCLAAQPSADAATNIELASRAQSTLTRGSVIRDTSGQPFAVVREVTDRRLTITVQNRKFAVPENAVRDGVAPAGLKRALEALALVIAAQEAKLDREAVRYVR